MESLEFYAQLLYNARALGGPKEFTDEQVQRLYEIRRQFGMTGKHPANICPNAKNGKASCHTCKVPSCSQSNTNPIEMCGSTDSQLVEQITKKVMEAMKNK